MLFQLAEAVRVELELERGGRWTCGIIRRASACGLEVALGGRSVDTRDLLQAGRRVRLLVSPRAEPGFVIGARVLWVDPSAEPGRAVRAQLAVEAGDAANTELWEGLVDRARKR